jgi:hypothetical protein
MTGGAQEFLSTVPHRTRPVAAPRRYGFLVKAILTGQVSEIFDTPFSRILEKGRARNVSGFPETSRRARWRRRYGFLIVDNTFPVFKLTLVS